MRRRTVVLGGLAAATAGTGSWWLLRNTASETGVAAAAGPVTTDAIGDQVQRVPKGQRPQFARTAELEQLYRDAVEHGEELQYIRCTCGCVRFGHKSNRDCYIKAFNSDGTLTFTSHAAT